MGPWGTELKWLLKVTHKTWWKNGGHVLPFSGLDQILTFWGEVSILAQPAPRVAGGFNRIKRCGSALGKPSLLLKQVSPVFLVGQCWGTRTFCLGSKEVTAQSQYAQRRSISTSALHRQVHIFPYHSQQDSTDEYGKLHFCHNWMTTSPSAKHSQLLVLFCIAVVFKLQPMSPWGMLAVWNWQIFHTKHAHKLNN